MGNPALLRKWQMLCSKKKSAVFWSEFPLTAARDGQVKRAWYDSDHDVILYSSQKKKVQTYSSYSHVGKTIFEGWSTYTKVIRLILK